MAGNRKITIEFLGDSKDLQNAIGDVDGKSSKLGATLGKVGKAAAIGLGAGLAVGAVALVKMTQGAIEDEAAQAKLAKQLENSAGATKKQVAATEEWISAQGLALGVTDDELRPALSKLATATGDVGKAQKLASLAMDVSAGSGKSLDSVATALMKAQNGQIAGLSKLGIETKNAAGETLTFEQVTKNMATTFQGQAATQAGTLEGKMARLKLIMAEAGETIGSKLIPVVTQMADWFLNKGLPAISAFGGWIQANLLPKLQQMGDWIQTKVLPALRGIGDWISQHVLPVLQKFGSEGPSVFSKVRSAVESVVQTVAGKLRPIFDQLADTFKSKVLPTVGLIIDRFQEWRPAIENVVSAVGKVVGKVLEFAAAILGKVLPPVIQFAGFLLSKLVPVVLDVVEVLAKIIAKVYAVGAAFVGGVADVAKFVTGLNQKIGNAIQTVSEIPGKVLSAIGNVGKTLYAAGSAIIQGLIDGIMAKVEVLKGKLREITNMIPDLKGPLDKDKILLKPAGEALIEGLISGIEKKKSKLETVLTKITDHIKAKQDKLASLLDNRQSIADSFRGFATSVFGADMGDAENPATAQSLVDHSAGQRGKAEQLSADVKALLEKGLSKEMINELIASGQSGMDQIHLLAGATAEQIAAINANQAAAQAALTAAGLAAADAVMGEQIAQAQRDVALADGIRDKLKELLDAQDKNTVVQLILDGKTLHASLLKLKKNQNKKLDLD